MNKDITMESVFFTGFKAAWQWWLADTIIGAPGEPTLEEQTRSKDYFDARSEAWLTYITSLEAEVTSG